MSAISEILLKNGTASLKDLYPLTKVNTEKDKKKLSTLGYNPGYTVSEWPYDLPVERVFYSNQLFPSTYFWHAVQGLMSQTQIYHLFEGCEVLIGGVSYRTVKEENP